MRGTSYDGPTKRYSGPPAAYTYNQTRADAVKQTFQISWDGYYKYAFPGDSLLPVTNTFENDSRNGWGASAIDAFSTALIMGNTEVVTQILDYVPEIDFSVSYNDTVVSLFETTIRYLGGLLAAYDLLTGPLASEYGNLTSKADTILTQAKSLGDNLKFAFNTATGIPDNSIYLDPPRLANSTTNGLATIGSLVLEWTRLSDLTGDPTYSDLAKKGESYLIHPKNPELGEPFPGLLGTDVSIANGSFVDSQGGWTGGTDSFYEYLIKMYVYDPVRFETYKDRWVLAVDSSIKYLASHPTSRPDLTFLAYYYNSSKSGIDYYSEHLACFDGGNFILGGLTLNEPTYIDFGLDLVAGCRDTYYQTATGIGPETFMWLGEYAPDNVPVPEGDESFYERAGFYITNAQYITRPEVVESFYYAYRATGDPKYQDWAWEAYLAINETCRVGSGYSSINDVNEVGGGGFQNFQESFWFAEVLKYSYLIHAEDAAYQVKADQTNEFVFNTEAHPVKIPGGESSKRRK
ncbi:family 47 glycoside hydrolase [Cryphonectria parasitica EP155]|uniref:alpha-1,2-Mannosidase n=1 Tax=Cryphonectria parasitica (strain ATCC 38755 / EP155) TaxID=660469 RepID=A0A9P4XVD3_CRYP1|nr:family 47 glycoside hydrolase [Cryphonectria parasitica EP155]KAF3761310.1 family 47 glycoside hydrolase [Cryphonectria parasitica EP155]